LNSIAGMDPVPPCWNDDVTRDFVKGKFLYEKGDLRAGLQLVEKAYLKSKHLAPECSAQMIRDEVNLGGFVSHRLTLLRLIRELPSCDLTLGEWVDTAEPILSGIGIADCTVKMAGRPMTIENILGTDAFAPKVNYRIGTVHSVKGETFDATLLILKKKGVGALYKTMLQKGTPSSESEELRIAYVGITRPRKVLMLAVPDDENKSAWEKALGV
jgi:DNA helicase II / ATP-dependent DNA helicase PcrA